MVTLALAYDIDALQQSGLRVGLFTSPHLHRLVERFRVDGRSMPQTEFARRVLHLEKGTLVEQAA